ncbi:MAG: hypothetical protein IKL44_05025 [Clostridia bacterium]|nr:hypothetical protein [Clostridia bacterium]
MKYKKAFVFLRRTVFLLVAVALMLTVNRIFERKTLTGEWNYTIKVGGFKNEPENSFSVLGFGSSHMYCTLNPISLYSETGIRSYVLATQQQPLEATYYYIKESFKTQKPDVVLLEAFMLTGSDSPATEGVAHDAVDPFPSGIGKLEMINAMNTEDDKENYYINFLKYHTRWKELGKHDFSFKYKSATDPFRGYVFLKSTVPAKVTAVDYSVVESTPIAEQKEEWLLKIMNLAEDEGARFVLLISPYEASVDDFGKYKYLHEFADKNGILVIDLNKNFADTGISPSTDFYDTGHLNVYGAEKASRYIGAVIAEKCGITPKDVSDTYLWEEDLKYYNNRKQSKE